MAVTLAEAVTALNSTLHALLPGIADPALAPELFVNPLSSQLVGIGGVVATRTQPPVGDVMARRVKAEIVVRVKAATVAELATSESNISTALLGADPVNLRSSGVFRIQRMVEAADRPVTGLPNIAGRDLRFEVLYEFSKLPEAGSGVIATVPVDLIQRITDQKAGALTELLRVDCEQDPLALFDVVDDSGLNEPGAWQYDGAQRELRQTSTAGGGSNNFNPSKRGTYLMVRSAVTPPAPRNFVIYSSVRSDTTGGIGLVFRFQDVDNFYYVLLHDNGNINAPFRFRIIGRKLAGAFSFLEHGGSDATTSYPPNAWFQLRLAVQDDQFDVAINGASVLSGQDASITAPGRIGFMSRSDAGARFRFLRWVAL